MEAQHLENSLFNPKRQQPYFDKFYLHAKDPYEGKHQLLINKRESRVLNDLKHLNDSKTCIEYLSHRNGTYQK